MRAPFNVLVFPYRKLRTGEFIYALFRRTDAGFWQGISGEGDDDESALVAAKRETREESGIAPEAAFLPLDTVVSVPVIEFADNHFWAADVYVIPQYCFGVLWEDSALLLSHEHTEYRWLDYTEARCMLKYDSNRTALWELNRRLSLSDRSDV